MSEPLPVDRSYWRAGDLSSAEEIVAKNLSEFSNVHLRRGWIPERFGEIANLTFCFVHIDVDLYQPTKDSVDFFFPRLEKGGMLICDDYGFTTCPGARAAMDEYFENRPERIVELPTGQGLVFKL